MDGGFRNDAMFCYTTRVGCDNQFSATAAHESNGPIERAIGETKLKTRACGSLANIPSIPSRHPTIQGALPVVGPLNASQTQDLHACMRPFNTATSSVTQSFPFGGFLIRPKFFRNGGPNVVGSYSGVDALLN